jgi:hypothetical protein
MKNLTASELEALGRTLRSLVETLLPTKAEGGMALSRLADLHTDYTPMQIQKMVRFLEAEILVIRGQRAEDPRYWVSSEGIASFRDFSDADWWRLAREFVSG